MGNRPWIKYDIMAWGVVAKICFPGKCARLSQRGDYSQVKILVGGCASVVCSQREAVDMIAHLKVAVVKAVLVVVRPFASGFVIMDVPLKHGKV